jgi:hypothetical protein
MMSIIECNYNKKTKKCTILTEELYNSSELLPWLHATAKLSLALIPMNVHA